MVAPTLLECSRRRSTRSPDHMVRSRTPQGSRGTERVLEKLDVVNFAVSQLREEREGRRDFLAGLARSEEHTSELQSQSNLVCRLLLEKKKNQTICQSVRGVLPCGDAQELMLL